MDQDHQERIRQRAHEIWESEGRPEGRDADHWTRAEEELSSQLDTDNLPTGDAGAEPEIVQAKAKKPAAKRTRKAKAEPTPYLNDGP